MRLLVSTTTTTIMYISPVAADMILSPIQRKATIILPDMFQTFLKEEPQVNPLYAEIKVESEAWLNKLVKFNSSPQAQLTQQTGSVPSHPRCRPR
jgi:hypothetical protein